MTEKEQRCYLYSPDCLQGEVFTGADAIESALEDGWVDNPTDAAAMKKGKGKSGTKGGKGKATDDES